MLAVGGFNKLATRFAVQAKVTHQSSNSTHTVLVTIGRELLLNPGRSIAPFVLMINVLNEELEAFIVGFPR